jgi:hypothetical protein
VVRRSAPVRAGWPEAGTIVSLRYVGRRLRARPSRGTPIVPSPRAGACWPRRRRSERIAVTSARQSGPRGGRSGRAANGKISSHRPPPDLDQRFSEHHPCQRHKSPREAIPTAAADLTLFDMLRAGEKCARDVRFFQVPVAEWPPRPALSGLLRWPQRPQIPSDFRGRSILPAWRCRRLEWPLATIGFNRFLDPIICARFEYFAPAMATFTDQAQPRNPQKPSLLRPLRRVRFGFLIVYQTRNRWGPVG